MMDFSQGAGQSSGSDLIPDGQLAWAILVIRGIKASDAGGQYLDAELTIDEGQPYGRKKIWDMIGDPMFAGNSEKYRQMGQVAIARILESGRGAGPSNPGGYHIPNYEAMSGLRVAIKIGIKKGDNGYDDKNRVAEYLTPSPGSQGGNKGFLLLQQGIFNAKSKPAAPAIQAAPSGFGVATPQVAPQAFGAGGGGGFGSPQTQQQAEPATGFSQPQGSGQTMGSPATTIASPSTSMGFATPPGAQGPTMASPSSGGWLQQANGGT